MDVVREKLNLLPDKPGVYIMLDRDSNIIYVGKAVSLKNRVRQYFHSSPKPEKVTRMVENIADFNYIITDTEIEALTLENNLIKKHKPKYNILLKDDKSYPYIKVNLAEDFPSFFLTRKILKDKAKYFGPVMAGINCRDILDILQLTFRVKICHTAVSEKERRPCLNNQIGRCYAPCAHLITKEDYAKCVDDAVGFLSGDFGKARKLLTDRMYRAADAENFELAMDCRNKLEILSRLEERRITALRNDIDADIVAYATNDIYSAVNVLFIRGGILQGGSSYALEDGSLSDSEALTNFMAEFYGPHLVPPEIITGECEDELLSAFFREKTGRTVTITHPKQGTKLRLFETAVKNAKDYLDKSVDRIKHRDDMTVNACAHLQEILLLRHYPKRMECYDISNVSGVDKVGAMVVFSDGEPDRNSYRRFKIKTVEGADDFSSLQEMLRRRLAYLSSPDEAKFPKPDLIIIDGGKGQLDAVKEIFDGLGIDDIDLISLAKKEEEIFVPGRSESIKIPHRDYALMMLQRIRDEAHRFAVTYFRNIHSKRNLSSVLLEIPGIGRQKRQALTDRFPSLDRIMAASESEIAETPGIGPVLAKNIKEYFESSL